MNAVTGTPFVCLHPQTIVNPYTGEKLTVPCGKCSACQSRKAARYVNQIELEANNSYAVLFVTLTFANAHIPKLEVVPVTPEHHLMESRYAVADSETGEVFTDTLIMRSHDLKVLKDKTYLFGKIPYLEKSYAQKFMKRLRKSLSQYNDEKIRYFLCGEYGPEHFRPHFHILLFLKSSVFLGATRKTLKDFPEWTWRYSQDPDPNAPLSVIECAIRENWRFGSIDAVLSKGKCASYVASYVNGFGNLPKILRLPQTKPFTCHSRFLGFEFCKKEREKVYASTPESVVRTGLSVGSIYKEFNMPLSYTNVFFPKCKGYALKSSRERMFTYRLYLIIRKEFPEAPLLTVAMDIVNMVMFYFDSYIDDKDKLPAGFSPMLALVLRYFKKSFNLRNCPFQEYTPEEVTTCINSCYRELTLSRHFLTFCCNGDYSQKATELYYNKIKDFYDYLERMKLARWYEEQQAYAEKDYAADETFAFFFDNIGLTNEEIQESLPYLEFVRSCADKQRRLIKHKMQNDLNAIFNNI